MLSNFSPFTNLSGLDPTDPRLTTGMNSTMPPKKVAVALSGGGARGDFEVGALLYLYEKVFDRPDIVTGTSVGAVNGSKIAEGSDTCVSELAQTWLELRYNSDMYVNEPWLNAIGFDIEEFMKRGTEEIAGSLTGAALLGPLGLIPSIFTVSATIEAIRNYVERLKTERSLYNLSPIWRRARIVEPYWSATGPGLRGKSIAVGRNADGRLEIFARAHDDVVYHKWQLEPNAMGAARWSQWVSLGGRISSDPVVIQNVDGTIRGIVARGEGNRFYATWRSIAPDGSFNWSAWEHFGDTSRQPAFEFFSHPTTARYGHDGTPLVLGRASFNKPLFKQWVPTHDMWSDWRILDILEPSIIAGNLSVGSNPNGAVSVVARGKDYNLYYADSTLPHAAIGDWRSWGGTFIGDPVIFSNRGVLEVFARGTDHAVYRRRQLGVGDQNWTSDWESLGGSFSSNVAVGQNHPSGRLELFGRGNDNSLYHTWQWAHDGAWNMPWSNLGKPEGIEWLSDPLVESNADGRMEVFIIGSDLALWHIWQVTPDNGWSNWESLRGALWPGISLRLALVSLETGDLRYVTEAGQFVGIPDEPLVWVADAVIASSSIPAVFPPVRLNNENYVDGGVRSITPIKAAFDAGADVVYAVVASKPTLSIGHQVLGPGHLGPGELRTFDNGNLLDIALRSITEIITTGIMEGELHPPVPWPKPVYIIQPTVEVHDPLRIDPGLIRISIDYGYMRAYDSVIAPDYGDAVVNDAKQTSDTIIRLRLDIRWREEQILQALFSLRQEPVPKNPFSPQARDKWELLVSMSAAGLPRDMSELRDKKRELRDAVNERRRRGYDLPATADSWSVNWEEHQRSFHSATPSAGFEVTNPLTGQPIIIDPE